MSPPDFASYSHKAYIYVIRQPLAEAVRHKVNPSLGYTYFDLYDDLRDLREIYNCPVRGKLAYEPDDSKKVQAELKNLAAQKGAGLVPMYLHWLWDKDEAQAQLLIDEADKVQEASVIKRQRQRKEQGPPTSPTVDIVASAERYKTDTSDANWLSPRNDTFIPFIGREEELAELDAFAMDHAKFKLWAVVGPSGAGKTRLLVHWANRDVMNGWKAIDVNSGTNIDWSNWSPDCPTLISIDYIYGYDEVISAIVSRAERSEFAHSVRLLILDHATPDTMAGLLKDPRWGFEAKRAEDFASMEERAFFRHAPLKLQVPENDHLLVRIVSSVSGRNVDDTATQEGLRYLEETTGARQPLFAALVGDAIRNKESYKAFNRRDLIRHYLQGKTRLTWLMEDRDKGAWAACFVAAATARRGVDFKTLRDAVPKEIRGSIDRDFKNFKALCNSVVSGTDQKKLKPFEPDILGETHFLLFLQEIEETLFDFEELLAPLITTGDESDIEKGADEFVAFITRMAGNLSNDDQKSEQTQAYWKLLKSFLTAERFAPEGPIRWAVSMANFEVFDTLREKEQMELADRFLGQIEDGENLFHPPKAKIGARYVWQAIRYFKIVEKEGEEIPSSLLELLCDWDSLDGRNYTALMLSLWAGSSRVSHYLLDQSSDFDCVAEDGWTALMFACEESDESVALRLVKVSANLDAHSSHGFTALMIASEHGREGIVLKLLEAKANLNAENQDGFTALMIACANNREAVALRLIEANANLDSQAPRGGTALMLAIENKLETVALKLVELNAGLEMQTPEGFTALMLACHYGQEVVALKIVDSSANVSIQANNGVTALMLAIENKLETVALKLVELSVNLEAQDKLGFTALMYACHFGQEAVALRLIELNANLEAQDREGFTALMLACYYGHEAVAMNLLEGQVDLEVHNEEGRTALMLSCWGGNNRIALRLIEKGANIDAVDIAADTALIHACIHGQDAIILGLIEAGVHLDAQNNCGQTALMHACVFNHEQAARILIEKKADIHVVSNDGRTALICACSDGPEAIAGMLIDQGADIHAVDENGYNAFMYACCNGRLELMKKLLRTGADIRETDNEGQTSLMLTCVHEQQEVAQALIERGVPLDDVGANGQNALLLAVEKNQIDVVCRMLESNVQLDHEWEKDGKRYTALGLAREKGYQEIIEMLEAAGALELPPYTPS